MDEEFDGDEAAALDLATVVEPDDFEAWYNDRFEEEFDEPFS